MTQARDQIFDAVRKSLGRGVLDEDRRAALDARISGHARGLVPARDHVDQAGQIALFLEKLEAVSGTVSRVDGVDDVPGAVAEYLANNNLPAAFQMAPDPTLDAIPWESRPALEVSRGATAGDDLTGLTAAFAAIAETGTLMLLSGTHAPTTLNFLPSTHVVVLFESQITGAYEDAWDRLRALPAMPRTVNLITGPSRTGDIEQTIYLGAHGPLNLHVVLVAQDLV